MQVSISKIDGVCVLTLKTSESCSKLKEGKARSPMNQSRTTFPNYGTRC